MIVIGSRRRNQPAPPHVLREALLDPDRAHVVWSSLWVKRPDALLDFDLDDGCSGTDRRWTLSVQAPAYSCA